MVYTCLIAFSLNSNLVPDLCFFDLLLKDKSTLIFVSVLVLALSLTLSTIDTLINAISSLIIVNGEQINRTLKGKEINKKTNRIILLLSIVVFILASKGYSILYLFLLADLLCCAAFVTIFYVCFTNIISSNIAFLSIFSVSNFSFTRPDNSLI
mgnify:CR=1 FL=1